MSKPGNSAVAPEVDWEFVRQSLEAGENGSAISKNQAPDWEFIRQSLEPMGMMPDGGPQVQPEDLEPGNAAVEPVQPVPEEIPEEEPGQIASEYLQAEHERGGEVSPIAQVPPREQLPQHEMAILQPAIREPEPQTAIQKVMGFFDKQWGPTEIDKKAHAQNVVQLAKQYNLPISEAQKYTRGPKDRLEPAVSAIITPAIAVGMATSAPATLAGLGAFMAASELANLGVSIIKGEDYQALAGKGLSDLLPKESNYAAKKLLDAVQFIGTAGLIGGGFKVGRPAFEKLTKDIVVNNNAPQYLYITPEKVRTATGGGEFVRDLDRPSTSAAARLLDALGIRGDKLKLAEDKGVAVPVESTTWLVDKPWFNNIKDVFSLMPPEKAKIIDYRIRGTRPPDRLLKDEAVSADTELIRKENARRDAEAPRAESQVRKEAIERDMTGGEPGTINAPAPTYTSPPKTRLGALVRQIRAKMARDTQVAQQTALPGQPGQLPAGETTAIEAPQATISEIEGVVPQEGVISQQQPEDAAEQPVSALAGEQARIKQETAEPTETEKKLAKAMEEEATATPTNSGAEDVSKPVPHTQPEQKVYERLGSGKTATIGRLIDVEGGEEFSLILKPDPSTMGTYTVAVKGDNGSQNMRMQYKGGELLTEAMGHFENYMNTSSNNKFTVELSEASKAKEDEGLSEHDRTRKKQLGELKNKKHITRATEIKIMRLEGEIKADPSKWSVGNGVGWYVGSATAKKRGDQVNRGYRIIELDAENKTAKIRSIADTGITNSGGNDDVLPNETVHIADLVRDKKYDKPETKPSTAPVTAEPVSEAVETKAETKLPWQMTLLEYGKSELAKRQPETAAQIKSVDQVKSYEAQHKKDIRAALERGDDVPESVLAEHPELTELPEKEYTAGKGQNVFLPDNTRIETEYAVVDLNELIASHTEDFALNKRYPQEMQPRDRDRKAMRYQVDQMAEKLEPARLMESNTASTGAPIIGPDFVVESGNGRVLALQKAYAGELGSKYRLALADNAEAIGVDVGDIEKPVLVRIRKTDVDRVEFAKKANQGEVARMSPVEQAKSDAERMEAADLKLFNPAKASTHSGTADTGGYAEIPMDKEFAQTSKGEFDFGVIPDEVAESIGYKAAPIRVRHATIKHIESHPNRVLDIKRAGYKNVAEMLEDVSQNYTEIIKGEGKSLLLRKRNGKDWVSIVELVPDKSGGFYTTKTAFISSKRYLKKKSPLWKRAPSSQPPKESPSAFEGQSESKESISQEKKNVKGRPSGEADTGSYADVGGYSGANEQPGSGPSVMDLPEVVWLAQELSGGRLPKVKKKLNGLGVVGRFRSGGKNAGAIEIRADLFKDPLQAAKTIAHEIGHINDWLPDKLMSRGNILGRIGSLVKYNKWHMAGAPGAEGLLTEKDRIRLRAEARKLLKAENRELIDEEIRKELPVTPEDVLGIWREATQGITKEKNPELYDYVQRLSNAEKKSIVKEAMKGQVPRRLQQFKKVVYEKTGRKISRGVGTVKAKYKELVKKEIERRRLLSRDQIMNELVDFTHAWKPFDAYADEAYTKYRYSSKELYADAMSALITNPGYLRDKAPRFYEGFFNYLDRKPQFKEIYERIQNEINSGTAQRNLVMRTRAGYMKREEEFRQGLAKSRTLWNKEAWGTAMVDKYFSITTRVKKVEGGESNIPAHLNPRYQVEALEHATNEAEGYMIEVEANVLDPLRRAGLSHIDLGEYMQHWRVATERAKLANPLGWTKERAEQRIEEMDREFGTLLKETAEAYRKIREEWFIEKAEKAEMYSDELMNNMKNTKHYATFDIVGHLEKRHGREATGHIYKQVGTFTETGNPLVATIMKDLALMRSINKNNAARSVVDFMKKYYQEEVKEADTRWNPKYKTHELVESGDPEFQLLVYMNKGKMEGVYVPKLIAESFKKNPVESSLIARGLRLIATPQRAVFVGYNPGFWLFNVFYRDLKSAVKQIPGLSLTKFMPYWIKAWPKAFRSTFGRPDETVKKMLKQGMLMSVVDYNEGAPEDLQMERLQKRFRVHPSTWNNGVWQKFLNLKRAVESISQAGERIPKIAGYEYLKKKFPNMPDEKIAHLVRTRSGSPDFSRQGTAGPIYNNSLIFSNAIKEGDRSALETIKDTPAEYAWKTAKYNIIPMLIKYAAYMGLFGLGVKKIFDRVSEYDLTNYHIIPCGLDENNKAVIIRVPQDETGRIVGGLVWKAMTGGDPTETMTNIIDFTAGQAPGLNPMAQMIWATVEYASGRNPYDSFRQRHALNEQVFLAGGPQKHKEFAKWVANQLGAGVVYRFKPGGIQGNKSELEKILGYPLVSNVVGRFIKVTDYGLREKINKDLDKVRRLAAKDMLLMNQALMKLFNGNGSEITDEELAATANKISSLPYHYRKALARKYGNVYAQRLITASGKAEREAIIKRMIGSNPDVFEGVESQKGKLETP